MLYDSLRPSELGRAALFAGFLVATSAVWAGPVRAEVVRLDTARLVHRSEQIVVAVVLESTPRWNERGNLIVTDYLLRVDELLQGSLPAAGVEPLLVTVLGGTLDGETHHTSLTTHLDVGARYLLFLEGPEDAGASPFTGAWQGVVRERVDAAGVARAEAPPLGDWAEARTFAELVERVRRQISEVAADPPPPEPTPKDDGPPLPSKTWDPQQLGAVARPTASPLLWDATPAALPAAAGSAPHAEAPAGGPRVDEKADLEASGASKYRVERWPSRPVIFDPFPLNWIWSPHDQYMMSYWNVYRPNLFRVWDPPSNTWAWGNGRFDLAGWPSNQDMIDQFGSGWGAGVLGITYYRWTSGPIIEADIALNPAFSWTLDNEYATRPNNSVHGFEQTMLHELGHSFGLQHPWETQNVWWDSVMNYAPKSFRHVLLHTDDANAVRAVYPGGTIHDALVTFHATADQTSSNHPIYTGGQMIPSTVAPGNSFSIYNLALENVGTDSVVNPKVEVYLTGQRMSWASNTYLGNRTLSSTLPPFSTLFFSLSNVTVPPGMPPGSYYVGLFVREDGDGYLSNNSAWSGYFDKVTVPAVPDLLAASGAEPYALFPGQPLAVTAQVSNGGNVTSASSQLAYRLSPDAVVDPGDTLLASTAVTGLDPEGSLGDTRTVAAPAAAGLYWIGACVDAVAGEIDLLDNRSAGTPVRVSIPNDRPLADGASHADTLAADVRNGAWDFFYFDVPEAGTELTVRFLDLPDETPQDLDLYVRFGDRPTLSEWDCRPALSGAALERCDLQVPTAGRVWIGVTNWDAGSILYEIEARSSAPIFTDGFESGDLSAWTGSL